MSRSEPSRDVSDAAAGGVDAVEVFERERPRLVGLAYRLLGSLADAEDVVQDAWIRWNRVDHSSIERPAAWLTTTVSRLGLDRLRSRRRAQTAYVGPWLPEPLVRPMTDAGTAPSHTGRSHRSPVDPSDTTAAADPAAHAELADSLTTAFLVLLERLSPDERLVLLLVDVFGESLRTAADTLGRSHDATRQLAVRARRKLTADAGALPTVRTAPQEQLAIAAAFVGAVMSGDLDAVRSMLHPDAVLTSDGGANRHAARRPVRGADRVARFLVNLARRLPPEVLGVAPVWVNGSPGVLVSVHGEPYMVNVIEVVGDQVVRQYSIVNPDKLASIGRSIELV
jgi:RNA polymerase sigma-70 factor (ECF subfamily)